jgi:hypothetical protein
MSDIESITRTNTAQFVAILRKAVPGVALPPNVVELMVSEILGKEKARVNDITFIRPTIDDVKNKLHGTALKLLPFMPDAIDYMIDEGRCPAIEYEHGLFLPCCKKCADGNSFCRTHLEKPTHFGTYEERLAEWDSMEAGKLAIEAPYGKEGKTKMYSEVTFGEYLINTANIDIEEAKRIIKMDAKLMVRLNERDLKIRPKTKKATGRPSTKKVMSLDDEEETEAEEPKPEEPKPVRRTKLTDEEREERARKAEEEKASKAVAKAEKEEAKRIEKAAKLKAEAEALERGEKVPKAKPKPKTRNPVDSREKFEGNKDDLSEIEYEIDGRQESYLLDPETSKVYDTNLFKVGNLVTNEDDDQEIVFDPAPGTKI